MNNSDTTNTFQGLGIAPKLMDILESLGFKTPTPIQRQSIPVAISGKDLIGIAQTGTGKTFAFGIPMLQRMAISKSKGLILVPTRELAVQVNESLKQLGRPLGLKTVVIIGGESMNRQMSEIRKQPHIIIATPGRLIDILEQKALNLNQTGILVLDEADRMLDMGFAPQLKKILPHLPKTRQTMLFSATMDESISNIAASYLNLPLRIEVAPAGSTVSKITQEIIMVAKTEKLQLLKKTLEQYNGSTLIFCRTKHSAKKITTIIRNLGHTAAEIHSNRSLGQRLEALNGFKIGRYRVLVATDIAARGIDVSNIELVINYDLPEQAEDYVHRIGRTARAGKTGHAISFATAEQHSDIRAIERLIKKNLPVSKASGLAAVTAAETESYAQEESYDRSARSFSRPRTGYGRSGDFKRPSYGSNRPHSNNNNGPRKSFSTPTPIKPRGTGPVPLRRKSFRGNDRFAPRKSSMPKDRGMGY